MENKTPNYVYDNVIQIDEATESRKFLANVFLWMFVALGLSAVCAYFFAIDPTLAASLRDPETGRNTGLGTVVMFSPLAFVLVMNFGFNRLSYGVLMLLFFAFAAVMGISLSYLLLIFASSSIFSVFLTTSLLFGIMAIAGYTTQTDLTKFGTIMIMLLVGIIIASLVNLFLASSSFYMLINYIAVAVFVGLTAYKVQMLKRIGAGLEYGSADSKKLALMGGFSLYLTFVNLFVRLLMIFGKRR